MKILKILFILLITTACNTSVPNDVIPPDKMIPIAEEMHLADAILTQKRILKGNEEAMTYYQHIYDKYNITPEDFETSITYYAKNPKPLRKAYAKVIALLSQRDSLLKAAEQSRIDTIQLWTGNPQYTVEKYTKETLPVSIPVEYQKTYTISAEIKIYNDSQIKEVTPHFEFVATDTTYVWLTKKITADTAFQEFNFSKIVSDSTITLLKGDFFPVEKDSIEQFKHYEIKNIKITTTSIDFNNTMKLEKAEEQTLQ